MTKHVTSVQNSFYGRVDALNDQKSIGRAFYDSTNMIFGEGIDKSFTNAIKGQKVTGPKNSNNNQYSSILYFNEANSRPKTVKYTFPAKYILEPNLYQLHLVLLV